MTTTATTSTNTAATEVHAWFSAETALRAGSCVYRKADGSTVNVTRTDLVKESKGSFWRDEKYLGAVVALEHGGCVRANRRVPSINC